MWCSSRRTPARRFALLAALAAALALAGCMSAPPDDSNLPWNKQQPWEGSPYVPPGMFAPQ
jgi:hypothetical protein